jgi:hypothetical protein
MPQRKRWTASAAAALVLLGAACAPANERPVRGAVPGTEAATPQGLPPTLTPSDALRLRALATPSPGISEAVSPSPEPSPSAVAAPPIVRTIAPVNNAHVPPTEPVTLSAVLVGRTADLASASLSVNGTDAGAQIDKRSARDWTIHASQKLANGTYTVKVLVRDASGGAGGFTWHIVVGDESEDSGVRSQESGSGSPNP